MLLKSTAGKSTHSTATTQIFIKKNLKRLIILKKILINEKTPLRYNSVTGGKTHISPEQYDKLKTPLNHNDSTQWTLKNHA